MPADLKSNISSFVPPEVNNTLSRVNDPKAFGQQILDKTKEKVISTALGYIQKLKDEIERTILTKIELISEKIIGAFQNSNKLYFCGNGGSSADSLHLAAEFSGRFYTDRDALPAEALHVNTSYLTAVANDYSYDVVYSRIIKGIGKPGDVLVGLSTSGNSANIVKAFEMAKEKS
jgi:D-sedoheptulose 7-phosphate isomerase